MTNGVSNNEKRVQLGTNARWTTTVPKTSNAANAPSAPVVPAPVEMNALGKAVTDGVNKIVAWGKSWF